MEASESLRETPPELGDGRYLVTAKIGEGGMALIYRAWDKRLSKWCAVKLMLPQFGKKRKLRKRFEQEAHTMARLEHKHIIRVYDVDTLGKIPYMVMELAEGGCIIDWVGTYGAMPPRMAIDVTIQLCKGLEASHDAGIIHRDIKPHNMLVNRRGVVKVTDFGIARVDDDQANLTKTGSVMGTFAYMAPEQRSNAKGVDRRADVYAIGATLYTLVTARTPVDLFVAEHDDSLLDGVNDLLKEVILKACAYRPDDRYDTAMELAKALHGLRKHMERTPADAPSLVLRNDELPERPPADLSAASFPEIAEAFNIQITNPTLEAAHSDPSDLHAQVSQPTLLPDELDDSPLPDEQQMGAPANQPSSVLPYQMPSMQQDFQPGERARRLMDDDQSQLPSYLVGTEEDENSDYYASLRRQQDEAYQRGEDEVTITAPSAPGREAAPISAQAVDAYQREKEYDPDAVAKNTHVIAGAESAGKMAVEAAEETFTIMMKALFAPLRVIAIPATAIFIIMGVTVAIGTMKVGKAHNAALSAHDQFIQEIVNQKALVEDLGAIGVETKAVEVLYREAQLYISRQDQFDRASKYLALSKEQFERYERTAPTSVSHKVTMARKRIQAIEIKQSRYIEALTNWEEVADTSTGRMAVGCHTAEKPE